MNRFALLVCLAWTGMGCEQSTTPPSIDEQTGRMPARLALREKPLNEPLTQDELLGFVELIESFPGGQPPQLSPRIAAGSVEGLLPEQAVQVWRTTLRQTLTTESLVNHWRPRAAERRVLTESQVTPQALASIMLRLSCAYAAEAFERELSITEAHRKAEQNVQTIVHQILISTRTHNQDQAALWAALEESTMLAEYLALLQEIPYESRHLVAVHRERLVTILPISQNRSAVLEQREDSRIIPVNYEEPALQTAAPPVSAPPSPKRDWKIR
ncbi:MAG: hypothetical protein DWH91_06215 [Planctomycetota bacterium]|nr:MAG: hypothetical protein DWH91_06215 [Planctomycetota bacterium]